MSAQALRINSPRRPELKIAIICEDLESGKHAKELQDQILTLLGSRIGLIAEVWTFRALQCSDLQELAAKEVGGADLILFSSRGDTAMPKGIKDWMERRMAQLERPRALVALFGPQEKPDLAHTTQLFLEKVAARGNLDFFVQRKSDGEGAGKADLRSPLSIPCEPPGNAVGKA